MPVHPLNREPLTLNHNLYYYSNYYPHKLLIYLPNVTVTDLVTSSALIHQPSYIIPQPSSLSHLPSSILHHTSSLRLQPSDFSLQTS